jgi:eukaryotic-like serine/threonine-protein kinase
MATVFLAHDLRHDRPVALKVLHPELATSLGPERFQREIKLAARLQHPHILTVHDSGESAGQLWYTMPFVRGESLRDRLRREGQLPIELVVELARQVALALDYSHGEGVVHRDLKPENILLSEGQALVADFGIAKAVSAAGETQLTDTGMAVGTPAYMSPEQAVGGQIDGRSDVYALGCVVYEMLAGEPPFTGSTPQALLAKRMLEPVPHVRTLRDIVSAPMEQALIRALAKVPADRFGTAGEFARALAQPHPDPVTIRSPTAPHRAGRRRVPVGLATIGLCVLLGLGVLLAWFRTHSEPVIADPKRLAVLPFENLGRPEDEYFADGMTDEVRGKLAALPGLAVIASGSSGAYKKTTKGLRQIGRELGVEYLLTGTIRWEKGPDGASRVRVSPQLVEVSTAASKWQEPFEAPLIDVFRVQADVAGRVADALGVALGARERERLGEAPTKDLEAYDAFLKGEAAAGFGSFEPRAQQQAINDYLRAVNLDSTFAQAWAKLSYAYSLRYWLRPTAEDARAARQAAERAVALAPQKVDGYLALGQYYASVAQDLPKAYDYSRKAEKLAPGEAFTMMATATGELFLGNREQALQRVRQVQLLDPVSVQTALFAADALVRLHRYPEAQSAAERALKLAPNNLEVIGANVVAHLGAGDLGAARSVLRAAQRKVESAALATYIATWGDLYWVLDEEEQHVLLGLSATPFGDDRAAWALALTETYALRNNARMVMAFADSARLVYEARLRDVPEDAATRAYLGLTLAYLGQKAEAVHQAERAVALMPIRRHPALGLALQYQLVRTYLLVGEPAKALQLVEPLISVPSQLSPGWLRIDPTFIPLRGDPRFERLVSGS